MFGLGKAKKLEADLAQVRQDLDRVSAQASAGPWESLEGALAGLSAAGVAVTPETAMRASAVFACTRLLSEAIAGLSLPIYERTPEGRKRVDHDIWWLLNESPTSICTAASFWEWMTRDMLLRGDGIAIIGRTANGLVKELIPTPRSNVVVDRKAGRLRYYVSTDEGYFGFDQDDVLHFPGFGFNGIHGMSVIEYAAKQAIGIALGAEDFAGKYYKNGAVPPVTLEVPGNLTAAQSNQLREDWRAVYGSGGDGTHLPLVLSGGMKAAALAVNPRDSQLMEARKFQVIDIARAFGVPPFMIGETEKTTSWGSGVEHMGMGFVRYTLRGPLQRAEQEMNRKFWPRSQRYFVEYNTASLMRGDSAAESAYMRSMVGGSAGPGIMTVNECRRVLNLPPAPGGDILYSPANANGTGATDATAEPAA